MGSIDLFGFFLGFAESLFCPNPNANFLGLVVGFEGALLAVAIPLSFSMVSNISEKFESDLITERFFNRFEIRIFPALLVAAIVLSAVLAFVDVAFYTNPLWKAGSWIAMGLFLVICIVFAHFINTVRRYIADVQNIIEELLDDAEKAIK